MSKLTPVSEAVARITICEETEKDAFCYCKPEDVGQTLNQRDQEWEKKLENDLTTPYFLGRKDQRQELLDAIAGMEAPRENQHDLEALHEGYFQALDDIKAIFK